MEPRDTLTISNNILEAWEDFTAAVGFVPDPMVVRAADLFLMGRSMAHDMADARADDVWAALEKNFSSILAFFDALVTRERIPLIDYWHTFTQFAIEGLLGDLAIRVYVQDQAYQHFHKHAVERLKQLGVDHLPLDEAAQIEPELTAFAYDWQPALGDLVIPETHMRVAQFLLGGLIFGAYAAKSGTDHLIQSNRSRLFVALSAPTNERQQWRAEHEQKLFASLRAACLTGEHVRVEDYPLAPSVVPYLLSKTKPANPRELFEKAIEFREREGKAYRKWFQALREAWSRGQAGGAEARTEVERVRRELEGQYKIDSSKPSATRVDVDFDIKPGGIGPGVTLKDLALPAWVRGWLPEDQNLKPHGKVLLRLSTAQRDYEDLVFGLKRLWEAALDLNSR